MIETKKINIEHSKVTNKLLGKLNRSSRRWQIFSSKTHQIRATALVRKDE